MAGFVDCAQASEPVSKDTRTGPRSPCASLRMIWLREEVG